MKEPKKLSNKKILKAVICGILAVILAFGIYFAVKIKRLSDYDFTTAPFEQSTVLQETTQENTQSTTIEETATTDLFSSESTTKTSESEPIATVENESVSVATSVNEPTSTVTTTAENTTKENISIVTTTEITTTPAKVEKNEYDIYRSGIFYATGEYTDSTGVSPLQMAISDSGMYMLTAFENTAIGVLVVDNATYLLYPDEKGYVELNATVMKLLGLSQDDLISSDTMNFKNLKPLSDIQNITTEQINGTEYKVYSYVNEENAIIKVFMNGNKLYEILELTSDLTPVYRLNFNEVTDEIPESYRKLPSDYKKMSIIAFAKKMMETEG